MKRLGLAAAVVCSSIAVFAISTAQAVPIFEEDFESAASGQQITLGSTTLSWGFGGGELADAYVLSETGNQFGRVFMIGNTGSSPAFSVGLLQLGSEIFSPVIDLSAGNIQISFQLRSDFSSPVSQVVAIQIEAVSNEDSVVRSFRTSDVDLQALPASSEGWVTREFLLTGLVDPANPGFTADLSQISKVEILFLQTMNDIPGNGIDVNYIDIDNFQGAEIPVPEPTTILLLGSAVAGLMKIRKK